MTGAALMFRRLKSGGKVFAVSGTPYVRTLEQFIAVYEERKRTGVPWPGLIKISTNTHPTPPSRNFQI
jgi:hypothetical protein